MGHQEAAGHAEDCAGASLALNEAEDHLRRQLHRRAGCWPSAGSAEAAQQAAAALELLAVEPAAVELAAAELAAVELAAVELAAGAPHPSNQSIAQRVHHSLEALTHQTTHREMSSHGHRATAPGMP